MVYTKVLLDCLLLECPLSERGSTNARTPLMVQYTVRIILDTHILSYGTPPNAIWPRAHHGQFLYV